MENGESGATGASACQSTPRELKFAIDFVTLQRLNTAASTVRWAGANIIESFKRDLQIELLKLLCLLFLGFKHGNAALQWHHQQHLGILFWTQNFRHAQQHRNHGRSWAQLSVRLYNPFIKVKTKEDARIFFSGLSRSWKRHVDDSGE